MADSKHTPGPWRLHKKSVMMAIKGRTHQIANDERFPTAFVPAWDAPKAGEVDGAEEALANAHLIAAAPDLLEALKDAEELLGAFLMDQNPVRVAARAAIAKAEGR